MILKTLSDLTIPKCISICLEHNFRFAGLTNGDECHCSNTDEKFLSAPSYHCNTPCSGDKNTFCGSSWRINVYDLTKFSKNSRLLTSPSTLGTFTFFQVL